MLVLTIRLVDADGTSSQTSGVPVTWTILEGGGALGRPADTTSLSGMTGTSWTLGPNEGSQSVEVSVGSFAPYVFTAVAVLPGPIAFLSNRRTGDQAGGFRVMAGDVFVMDDDGSNVIQLSPGSPAWDWLSDPSWSPDGQRLAYVRSLVGEIYGPIYVIDSDGDGETQVGPSGWSYAGLAWCPDARRLVAWTPFSPGLWIVFASANVSYTRLTWQPSSELEQDSRSPDWSPDGGTIAFECGVVGSAGICTFRDDGSDLQRLTSGPADTDPAWSPDGSRILFARDTTNAGGIWVMNADGSGLEQVLDGYASSPSWSPDGTQFAVAIADGSRKDIWRVTIATGEAINLTQGVGINWDPAWRW
jgi:Tol biopolymer transport system component